MSKEARDKAIMNICWDSERPKQEGGQRCGMPNYPVILISDEYDIKITVGTYKSQIKNRELAFTLFDLALMEIIKPFD